MKFLVSIVLLLATTIFTLSLVSPAAQAQTNRGASTRERIVPTRERIVKYDTMTLEMADPNFPKMTIRAKAGTLVYFMDYMNEGILSSDLFSALIDPACEKISCNAVEIMVIFKPDITGYKVSLIEDKASKIKKTAKHRPIKLEILISDQQPEPDPPPESKRDDSIDS